MSKLEIPESWAEAILEECLVEFGRGKSPKYSEKETGYYAVNQRCVYWDDFRAENRKLGTKDWFNRIDERHRLRVGDILVNSTGTGTLGRAVCLKENFQDSIPDSHVTLIRAKELLHPSFLVSFIKSAQGQDAIDKATTGSTNQIELNKTKLGLTSVPIPPLGEQKRIVAKIESTQEKIKAIEQSVRKAEELIGKLRSSILATAFTGRLVPQNLSEGMGHELSEQIRQTQTGFDVVQLVLRTTDRERPMSKLEIPESWGEAKIDDLSERKGGGTPSRKNPNYFSGNIPWITVADIPRDQGGVFTINSSREFITAKAIQESSTHLIPKGSIILSTRVSVGKVGINAVDLCTNQDFSSFINCKVDTKFFANFLFQKQTYFLREAKGATIQGISLPTVTELLMPIPPLGEQKRIVAKIESTQEKIKAIEQSVRKAEELIGKYREALLQKAFRGELVPQNHSEGTGHELLEKIKRSSQSTVKPDKTLANKLSNGRKWKSK